MYFIADIRKFLKILFIFIILFIIFEIIKNYSLFKVDICGEKASIHINFLLPMKQESIDSIIKIKPQIPLSKFEYNYYWKGKTNLYINIKEVNDIKGQKIKLSINNIKSQIPFISKNINKNIQFVCKPQFIKAEPLDNTSTKPSIKIYFNTFIDYKALKENIDSGFTYTIEPINKSISGIDYVDYSSYTLYSNERLENDKAYNIVLGKDILASCGERLKESKISFNTTKKPKIISSLPNMDSKWTSLYPRITIEADCNIKMANIKMDGIEFEKSINKNKVEFLPKELLKEDKEYIASINISTIYNEYSDEYKLKFKTMPLKDDYIWVEVNTKDTNKVVIHKGERVVKQMLCSCGRDDSPTVMGTFYIKDRGEYFFSQKYNEGARYWVRIMDNYLFHGIPRDSDWNIIESERKKIGSSASHGCVRLSEEDAKWFYDNIPQKTMVIIHK